MRPSSMRFYARQEQPGNEWLVWAECPAAGGDGAVLAVFETELAAKSLADVLNHILNHTARAYDGSRAAAGNTPVVDTLD